MKRERPFGLPFNCPVRNLPCTEGGCAWWDDERSACGVLSIEAAVLHLETIEQALEEFYKLLNNRL